MAKEKKEKILEQTISTFRGVGIVTGVDRDNFYNTGIVEKGKNEGKEYRSLRFGVRTSPNQTIYVQMFGMEPDNVYVYDNKEKKGEQVPYEEFLEKEASWAEEGKITFDSSVNLDSTDKKAPKSHMPKFDNIDLIYDKLENGMSVYVSGRISRNSYENQNGDIVTRTNNDLQQILLADDVDFDSKKFREYAVFTEEFVVTDTEYDKEEEKLIISGLSIDYSENTYPVSFDVSHAEELNGKPETYEGMSDSEIEKNKKYVEEQVEMKKKMINAFKKLKYGTLLKVDGKILNKVTVTEQVDEEEDDLLSAMRGNSKKAIRDYSQTLSISGTDSYTPSKYTEEDFFKAKQKNQLVSSSVEVEEKDELGDLRGSKEKDPFEGSSIDISEYDLPF